MVFRTKYWYEINDDTNGKYHRNSKIKYKTLMLWSSLRHYSDAYILVSETIIIIGAGADVGSKRLDERNKVVILHYLLTV